MITLYNRSDFISISELRYRWKNIPVQEIIYLLENREINIYSLESNYGNNKIRVEKVNFPTYSLSLSPKKDYDVISGLDYDDVRKKTVIISLEGIIDTDPPIDDGFDALVMVSEVKTIENLWQRQDKQAQDLKQVRAQLAEVTQKCEQATIRADFLEREKARKERENAARKHLLASAQGEIKGLRDEIERLQPLAEKSAAQCQGVDAEKDAHAKMREELAKDQEEPGPRTTKTYLTLLDALFQKIGVDCKNVREGGKNKETGIVRNALHLGGRHLEDNTIRAKIREVQDFIERVPRAQKLK